MTDAIRVVLTLPRYLPPLLYRMHVYNRGADTNHVPMCCALPGGCVEEERLKLSAGRTRWPHRRFVQPTELWRGYTELRLAPSVPSSMGSLIVFYTREPSLLSDAIHMRGIAPRTPPFSDSYRDISCHARNNKCCKSEPPSIFAPTSTIPSPDPAVIYRASHTAGTLLGLRLCVGTQIQDARKSLKVLTYILDHRWGRCHDRLRDLKIHRA